MRELSKKEMLEYFEVINQKLAKNGKHGEIVLAGGASLAMVFDARDSTRDIDAIFQPSEEMRQIVKDMADEYDLPDDWLNDGVKGYISEKMNQKKYISLSNLDVYSIDAEGLLAMKLTSARVDTKDMEDSIFLMKLLNIREEKVLFAIIDKYTHPNQRTIASKYFTQEAFEKHINGLNPREQTTERENAQIPDDDIIP